MRTRLGRTVLIQTLAVCGAAVASSPAQVSGPVESRGFEVGTAKIEGYVYVNAKTGEVRRTPASAVERRGDNYWKNDDTTGSCGYFMQQDLPTRDTAATGRVRFGSAVVHWGDIPVGGRVDGFDVGYATNVGVDPAGAGVPGLDLTAVFIDDYDGDLNPGGTGASGIGGFLLQDIPGGNGATGVQGWIYIVDLEGSGLEFEWGSSDLDGDGLHDFGYSYSFDQNQTSAKGVAGPLLVRPFSLGGAGTAIGCPDQLDWFNGGDDFTGYFGGLWFGGGSCPARPYASTYMNVYGSTVSQEVNAFGLDHTASGSATLSKIVTPEGPALVVSGLGGGSSDRVAVDVGATRQVKIEMGASSTTHGTQVVEFNGTLMGGGAQKLGSLTAIDDAEGVTIRPNFAPVGASTFTAEVYDQGALVARIPGQTEFKLLPAELPIWLIIVIIIIVIIWLSDEDCEVEASMTVPAGVTAVIAGMALHGDTIRMVPDAQQPPVGHLTSVDTFTTGVDSLMFHGESVGVSGVYVSALGEAALAPAEDRITITNIGSSGQDGVRMLPVRVSTIDWAFDPPCFDCPLCPNGRWADVAAIGSFGGAPDHPLGSIRFTAVGADWRINADYSAVGSAAKRLVAYKDGAIVQQVTGFTGGVVGMVQDPPSGCGKGLAIIDGRHTACYFVRWPTAGGTHLTIPGHSTVVCDGFAVLAEAPTADVGAVSEIAIKSADIPQMIIFDVTRTAYCPVDLNQDGIVDFLDYLDFLNRFEVEDPAVDFNGDGIVDFLDYLEFLNLFNEGC